MSAWTSKNSISTKASNFQIFLKKNGLPTKTLKQLNTISHRPQTYHINLVDQTHILHWRISRKLGDRFREHLLDVKNKGSDLSKPVARHFNLPGHSHEHMEICGFYLHLGNNETRKRKEQRLIFKLGTLAPNGINEQFSFA